MYYITRNSISSGLYHGLAYEKTFCSFDILLHRRLTRAQKLGIEGGFGGIQQLLVQLKGELQHEQQRGQGRRASDVLLLLQIVRESAKNDKRESLLDPRHQINFGLRSKLHIIYWVDMII